MSECLVCYETFAQGLTSMCQACQQAFVCQGCRQHWKETCHRRGQMFSCPKCRAPLETIPTRRLQRVAVPVLFASAMMDPSESQWLQIAKSVVTLFLICMFAMPLVILVSIFIRKVSTSTLGAWTRGLQRVATVLASVAFSLVWASFVLYFFRDAQTTNLV